MKKFFLQQIANFYIFLLKRTKNDLVWKKMYNNAIIFNTFCVKMDIYLN